MAEVHRNMEHVDLLSLVKDFDVTESRPRVTVHETATGRRVKRLTSSQ